MSDPTSDASDIVLEVRHATRRFGGLVALNDVSFSVRRNEIFGLIGPNGAGKTTMFNVLTGLQSASPGSVLHDGADITRLKPHEIARRGVARTFQNIRLFGALSVLENIKIAHHLHTRTNTLAGVFARPRSRREELEVDRSARELLALVGLQGRPAERAGALPYGDQRRLEIARALATAPAVLLLDEPAAGMNTSEKAGLAAFIRDIRNRFNLTVLLIEHSVPLVMRLCDRVAVLNFGELIALGTPTAVQNDPVVVEAYLGAP